MDKLTNANIGKFYTVKGFVEGASIKIKRRILELGFTRGQKIKIVRKSLLGKAFLVELRGFTLTIRKDIAGIILVE